MNIKKAQEQIRNAMKAYFTKDSYGEYVLPPEKQRPVFLMGPPGIGKTAIMEQLAAELGVGLVTYSMTHHTRQSALGLPYIAQKSYEGMDYQISEYTMSEIIASVYEVMSGTGVREGILFLDEINCVSETLSPVMLEFLQYKVFGRHHVPQGWIVVTAGNPPEYNHAAREFDVATWDRLKRIDVEPDYDIWKEYAMSHEIHPVVVGYLDMKPGDFYRVDYESGEKAFVTARGWEDLSRILLLYELHSLPVDEELVGQYLHDERIKKEFTAYYQMFEKNRTEYQIPRILAGNEDPSVREHAAAAGKKERLTILSLLLDTVSGEIQPVMRREKLLGEILQFLKQSRSVKWDQDLTPRQYLETETEKLRQNIRKGRKSGSLSAQSVGYKKERIRILEEMLENTRNDGSDAEVVGIWRESYDRMIREMEDQASVVSDRLSRAIRFLWDVLGDSTEFLLFMTRLTALGTCAAFIDRFGCEEYFRHNDGLLLYKKEEKLREEIRNLQWGKK